MPPVPHRRRRFAEVLPELRDHAACRSGRSGGGCRRAGRGGRAPGRRDDRAGPGRQVQGHSPAGRGRNGRRLRGRADSSAPPSARSRSRRCTRTCRATRRSRRASSARSAPSRSSSTRTRSRSTTSARTPTGILYIVMEFLQGKSLADALEKDGPMEPERVEKIMEQICGSLAEAHARGIVHRDLKPDNIVLVERAGKKDFVKVLDFGIAKRSKRRGQERAEAHPAGHGARHAAVHEPRAVHGQAHRRAQRHLLARR